MSNNEATLIKQKKFAWAKVYESYEYQLELYGRVRDMEAILDNERKKTDVEIPKHFFELFTEMAEELKKKFNCPICLEDVEKGKYKITSCGHIYCGDCFDKLITQDNPSCAMCRRKFK